MICDQWLGSNGYAGMKALRRAGWAVRVIPEWEFIPVLWRSRSMRGLARGIRSAAVREFTQEVVLQAERLMPEFLLVFKGTFVQAELLRSLKQRGVRTYCFFPDVSFRAHGPHIPDALRQYDWVFTTKSFGLRDLKDQLGVTNARLICHAYDRDLHRPVELSAFDLARYECDVSFIGTWSPKKEQLLAELRRRRPALRLRVWGEQWHRSRSPVLSPCIGGHEVVGEEYVRALQASTINLAILSERRAGSSDGDQVTSRTFHIPACGAFMLHERSDEVLGLFKEGESIACYGGLDELVAQIDLFLADELRRRAISGAGQALVSSAHSWDHRIREILAHIEISGQ